ncbi:hypothetical protein ABTM81_19390, partial [Acinetobacter baumannii]
LTVELKASGRLTARRAITTSWNEFLTLDDVVLAQRDTNLTTVAFPSTCQVARGGIETDADGTRRATLIVNGGTNAYKRAFDGSTSPLPVGT